MAVITPDYPKLTDAPADRACDGECCAVSDDGGAICIIPNDAAQLAPVSRSGLWQRSRGMVMFAVACITSPCCTPLIVPVLLSLLAGTPAAVWIGHNLGWVFGGLTLISAISLTLSFRWMRQHRTG